MKGFAVSVLLAIFFTPGICQAVKTDMAFWLEQGVYGDSDVDTDAKGFLKLEHTGNAWGRSYFIHVQGKGFADVDGYRENSFSVSYDNSFSPPAYITLHSAYLKVESLLPGFDVKLGRLFRVSPLWMFVDGLDLSYRTDVKSGEVEASLYLGRGVDYFRKPGRYFVLGGTLSYAPEWWLKMKLEDFFRFDNYLRLSANYIPIKHMDLSASLNLINETPQLYRVMWEMSIIPAVLSTYLTWEHKLMSGVNGHDDWRFDFHTYSSDDWERYLSRLNLDFEGPYYRINGGTVWNVDEDLTVSIEVSWRYLIHSGDENWFNTSRISSSLNIYFIKLHIPLTEYRLDNVQLALKTSVEEDLRELLPNSRRYLYLKLTYIMGWLSSRVEVDFWYERTATGNYRFYRGDAGVRWDVNPLRGLRTFIELRFVKDGYLRQAYGMHEAGKAYVGFEYEI